MKLLTSLASLALGKIATNINTFLSKIQFQLLTSSMNKIHINYDPLDN
jgi:hypothetical protein